MSSDTAAVVVVWDGFRGTDMSWDLTPNLMALGERGTVFGESRCAYPSLTRVNCASLVTGSWAAGHGVAGNTLYVPEIDSGGPCSLASAEVIHGLAGLRGGKLFGDLPSLGDVLAESGRTLMVASAASPGSSTILGWGSAAMLADGLPATGMLAGAVAEYGVPPGRRSPDPTALNRYIGRAVVDFVIPRGRPDVLVVWFCEPDASQHRYGLGTPEVREAIRANDELLGSIVAAVGDEGHVIVTSDHGHTSTEVQDASTADLLDRATGLRSDVDYVLTSDGVHLAGSASEDDVGRVVAALRDIPTIGAVFTKREHPDAMPMGQVQLGGPWAPDIKYSHRLRAGSDDAPTTVTVGAECEYASTHGSIEASDMRNLLVAAGPTIRNGPPSQVPSGIVDIGPTILGMLGIPVPTAWDGRTLHEALVGHASAPAVVDSSVDATWRRDGRVLGQAVRRATVNGTTYVLSGSTTTEALGHDATRH